MFIPYTVDVPMERLPIANWVLMVLIFCISLGVWVKDSHRPRITQRGIQFPPRLEQKARDLQNNPHTTEEEWRQFDREVEAALAEAIDAPSGALDPHNFSVFQLITYQFVHGGNGLRNAVAHFIVGVACLRQATICHPAHVRVLVERSCHPK